MIVDTLDAVGEIALTIDRPRLIEAMIGLRDTPGLQYQQLMEIAGVDYPDREDRFDVCYHLLSLTKNRRLRVRVITDDVKPVPSVTGIWRVAGRSDERRVGKEWVRTCRSRWARYNENNTTKRHSHKQYMTLLDSST